MESGLFDAVTSQRIDNSGKTRMLIYRGGICLMTSPIPPLDLPVTQDITPVDISDAMDFIKDKNLEVVGQDGNPKDGIQGLWVNPKLSSDIYSGYIPVIVTPALDDIPFNSNNDPLRTEGESSLANFRHSRRLAEFLKQYTLFSYAHNPEMFGEDSFIIDSYHKYEIETLNKKLILDNPVMYRDQRLIVPSLHIRDKLLAYLRVSLNRDTPGVLEMKNLTAIDNYYQTISDFRPSDNQIIFTNKNGLLRWALSVEGKQNPERIVTIPSPAAVEPYFYRGVKIRNKELMLIQNVDKGKLDLAIAVGYEWITNRRNLGYRPDLPDNIKKISYVVYDHLVGQIKKVSNQTSVYVNVIKYDQNNYGALLKFK